MEQSTTAKENTMNISEKNSDAVFDGRTRIHSTINDLKYEIEKMEKYMSNAPTDPELRLSTTVHNLYAMVASLHTSIAINAGIIKGHDNQFKGLGA